MQREYENILRSKEFYHQLKENSYNNEYICKLENYVNYLIDETSVWYRNKEIAIAVNLLLAVDRRYDITRTDLIRKPNNHYWRYKGNGSHLL